MTATETKAKILSLLDEVASGEQVEITKHGHVVAKLIPAGGPASLKSALAGLAKTSTANEDDLFATGSDWQLS
jgi:prevent-host-death family protein